MKKIKYFMILCATILLVSGCGKKIDAKNLIEDASKKMEDLKSFNMNLNIDMAFSSQGFSVGMQADVAGEVDVKNNITHTTTTATVLGMTTTSESYDIQKDGKEITYTSDDEGETWTYETKEVSEGKTEIINITDKYKSVKKVKSDEKGLTKLEVTFDKKFFNDNSDMFGDGLDMDSMSLDKDLVMYVYIDEDSHITKMVMDLKEYIDEDSLNKDSETNLTIDKIVITIEFSKFDKVGELTVPEKIINDATLSNESDDISDEYTEEDILYDIVLSAETDCTQKTYDFSAYDGSLNDWLYLDEYDITSVTEGIVTIDSSCDATIDKEFKINGKTCSLDEYGFAECN